MTEKRYPGMFEISGMDAEIPEHKSGTKYNRFSYLASKRLKENREENDSDSESEPQERSEGAYTASQLHIEKVHLDSIREDLNILNQDLQNNGHSIRYEIIRRPAK